MTYANFAFRQSPVMVEPPGQHHPKPLFIRVHAYELTYSVRYSDPGLVR
jgi:hypothetical protein